MISLPAGLQRSDADESGAELAARLTEAAYEVALRHGVRGSFAELELDLWRTIRSVVAAGLLAPRGDGA